MLLRTLADYETMVGTFMETHSTSHDKITRGNMADSSVAHLRGCSHICSKFIIATQNSFSANFPCFSPWNSNYFFFMMLKFFYSILVFGNVHLNWILFLFLKRASWSLWKCGQRCFIENLSRPYEIYLIRMCMIWFKLYRWHKHYLFTNCQVNM